MSSKFLKKDKRLSTLGKTEAILKLVAEALYEEEGTFFVTLQADDLNLPLDGIQRLVLGGRATPDLEIKDEGIDASLSFNRVHYDVHIPWQSVAALEGNNKAFFCNTKLDNIINENEEKTTKKKTSHLKLVK